MLTGALVLALLLAAAPTETTPGTVDALPAASSGNAIWVVEVGSDEAEGDSGFVLSYMDARTALAAPAARAMQQLPGDPEAMAASGQTVFLVYAPGDRTPDRRECYALEAKWNPAAGVYAPVPADRLRLLAALPGEAALLGFAADADGPIALLRGAALAADQSPAAPAAADDADNAGAAHPPGTTRLLRHEGTAWTDLELPDSLDTTAPIALAAGTHPLLLGRSLDGAQRLWRLVDGWESSRVIDVAPAPPTPADAGRSLVVIGDRVATVDRHGDTIELAWILGDQLVPLPARSFPQAGSLAVVGVADDPGVVVRSGSVLALEVLDRLDASTRGGGTVTRAAGGGVQAWNMAVSLGLLLGVVLTLALLRGGAAPGQTTPAGTKPPGASARIVALGIDMVPAAVAIMLTFRVAPLDLLVPPVVTPAIADAIPWTVMVLVTCLLGAVCEMITGTTPGKRLIRARVVRMDGERARWPQLAVRSTLKAFELLIPPVAVFHLLNPNQQGIGDVIARTVVVVPAPDAPTDE